MHNLSRSGWLLLTHYASLLQMLADNALAFGKSQTYSFLFHTAFFTASFGCLYCLLPHLPLQDDISVEDEQAVQIHLYNLKWMLK